MHCSGALRSCPAPSPRGDALGGGGGAAEAHTRSPLPRSASSPYNIGHSTNIKWQEGGVTKVQKELLMQQKGCILWFTGLSGR